MSLTNFAEREVASLLRIGLYQSREEVISDAVRNLLLNNRLLRLEMALDLFKNNEISLGRAAEMAGLDRWQFEETLSERSIPIVIETESAEAMDDDLALFFSQPA